MKPTFILGMGAQKAGTSWLHNVFVQNKNTNMGFMKEYHIWDAVFSDLCKIFKVELKNPDNAASALRRMMQSDPEIYIKYFQSLISSDVSVTGDITPSYSVLDKYSLEKVARYLDDGGFEVKVIFLMRDPIERIWSLVRMEERRRKKNGAQLDGNFAQVRVLEYLEMNERIARSDYKTTVNNIESVFHNDNIYYELYENLFNSASIKRINSFLGLHPSASEIDFETRVNSSPSVERSERTTKKLEEFLKPQYEFCKDKFPITKKFWAPVA